MVEIANLANAIDVDREVVSVLTSTVSRLAMDLAKVNVTLMKFLAKDPKPTRN